MTLAALQPKKHISSTCMELNPLHAHTFIRQMPQALGASSASAALVDYTLQRFARQHMRVLELGSGSGVISIMLALARTGWQIKGLEIQQELFTLAQENVRDMNTDIEFVQADLRTYSASEPYDLVLANPPWQKQSQGLISPLQVRAVSRSEIMCSLPEVVACCVRNLAAKGTALLLYPPSRSQELLCQAASVGLQTVDVCTSSPQWTIFQFIKG